MMFIMDYFRTSYLQDYNAYVPRWETRYYANPIARRWLQTNVDPLMFFFALVHLLKGSE